MVRRLPTITPTISSSTNTHSTGLAGSANVAGRREQVHRRAGGVEHAATRRVEASITVRLRWWSTRLPNHMPDSAVSARKMPAITPVANTERVSR